MIKIVNYYPGTNTLFPLEELEKFGFYKASNFNNSWKYDLAPTMSVEFKDFSNKKFSVFSVQELNEEGVNTNRELKIIDTINDDVCWNMDILYDLIQANLVEKVGGENVKTKRKS